MVDDTIEQRAAQTLGPVFSYSSKERLLVNSSWQGPNSLKLCQQDGMMFFFSPVADAPGS
ncbi:hypothetical protein [Rhizobium sp. M1]|uniref:hypothetical protein n=1 Tax=Rhizobium sp. M1 TaxID=2035453 RepID=UPI0011447239|nr:hypothetical protein [Rhizobium sp. M1]